MLSVPPAQVGGSHLTASRMPPGRAKIAYALTASNLGQTLLKDGNDKDEDGAEHDTNKGPSRCGLEVPIVGQPATPFQAQKHQQGQERQGDRQAHRHERPDPE